MPEELSYLLGACKPSHLFVVRFRRPKSTTQLASNSGLGSAAFRFRLYTDLGRLVE